jgi:hypothetical protein
MITNFKIFENFENSTQFNVGDWVYLDDVNIGTHLKNLVLYEPAQITSIKQHTKYNKKYTLTYLKGWQYSFVVDDADPWKINSWIRHAYPAEIEKFKDRIEEFKFKQDAKRYNL